MNPESIGAIGAGMMEGPPELFRPVDPSVAASTGTGSFSQFISQGLEQVNTQLQVSQTGLQKLALGDATNLHQVMIQLEESRIAFQLTMQVRNRLLEAYQEVMRMQV